MPVRTDKRQPCDQTGSDKHALTETGNGQADRLRARERVPTDHDKRYRKPNGHVPVQEIRLYRPVLDVGSAVKGPSCNPAYLTYWTTQTLLIKVIDGREIVAGNGENSENDSHGNDRRWEIDMLLVE